MTNPTGKEWDGLKKAVHTYTETVFWHSIALSHGLTHDDAADKIIENIEQYIATLQSQHEREVELAKLDAKIEEDVYLWSVRRHEDGSGADYLLNRSDEIAKRKLALLHNKEGR